MDKILNHRTGVVKGVAAVYQRAAYLEQRKAAMTTWANYIARNADNIARGPSDELGCSR